MDFYYHPIFGLQVTFERDPLDVKIKWYKPPLVERILIFFKIIKDRRYAASKVNRCLLDEAEVWEFRKFGADPYKSKGGISKGAVWKAPLKITSNVN